MEKKLLKTYHLQNRPRLFSELTKVGLFSVGDLPSLVLIHCSARLVFYSWCF